MFTIYMYRDTYRIVGLVEIPSPSVGDYSVASVLLQEYKVSGMLEKEIFISRNFLTKHFENVSWDPYGPALRRNHFITGTSLSFFMST